MAAPIYLDYNATTPVDPAVVEAMLPFLTEHFGNPSSGLHAYGWAAEGAVEQAAERLGALLNADPRALVWTSGATEACNLALKGAARAYSRRRTRVVTVATEHAAVLAAAADLERDGFEVVRLPVEPSGLLDLDRLEEAVTSKTSVVAVMWANNETGVLQDLPAIAEVVHAQGALLFSDATQAVGKVPVDVAAADVDLLALSGHKLYAPKGVGALYVRRRGPRVRLVPQIVGGKQQKKLRGGTLNVPGIVALGKAAEVVGARQAEEAVRLQGLRDRLEAALKTEAGAVIHGAAAPRLPNTTYAGFPDAPSSKLVRRLRGLALSTGSACKTKATTPSPTLTAMGVPPELAFSTLRISLGHGTTEAHVDAAIEQITAAVEAVRGSAIAA